MVLNVYCMGFLGADFIQRALTYLLDGSNSASIADSAASRTTAACIEIALICLVLLCRMLWMGSLSTTVCLACCTGGGADYCWEASCSEVLPVVFPEWKVGQRGEKGIPGYLPGRAVIHSQPSHTVIAIQQAWGQCRKGHRNNIMVLKLVLLDFLTKL